MSGDDPHLKLRDFVAWVRWRRAIRPDAWIDQESLEFVTQGIERFLDGQNPWPKVRGNKAKPELMWRIFWYCHWDSSHFSPLLTKRHKDVNGLYQAVGDELNLSADAVESSYRKAVKTFKTPAGKIQFSSWLSKEKGASYVRISSQNGQK